MRCNHCGKKVVRFPIKQQENKTIVQNYKDGSIIWKNLFKMDWNSIVLFAIVILLVFSYKHETEKCDQAYNNPCGFCVDTGCCPENYIFEPNGDTFVRLNSFEKKVG